MCFLFVLSEEYKNRSSKIETDRKKFEKKKIEKKKWKLFLEKTIFVRKKISQNVFWINWGSGEYEEKFLEVEGGQERSKT